MRAAKCVLRDLLISGLGNFAQFLSVGNAVAFSASPLVWVLLDLYAEESFVSLCN